MGEVGEGRWQGRVCQVRDKGRGVNVGRGGRGRVR